MVADAAHAPGVTGVELVEAVRGCHGDAALCVGDGVPVGIAGWVAQFGAHTFNEVLGNSVFKLLGLVVDLIPRVAKLADQVAFKEPVPAHHGQCQCQALCCQVDGGVRLVVHQTLVLELAHHL